MKRSFVPATVAAVSAALVLGLGSSAAEATKAVATKPSTQKVIMFSSDGMRPDLMQRYAAAGAMPTYQALMNAGVIGDNGMKQAFPPNTGVGWYTMATGTWPSEHGSTNNTFHRTGEGNFNNSTSGLTTGIPQADSIMQAAERAGKTVVSVEWAGSRNFVNPALQGPVVDFRSFFGGRARQQAALASSTSSGHSPTQQAGPPFPHQTALRRRRSSPTTTQGFPAAAFGTSTSMTRRTTAPRTTTGRSS